MVFLAYVNTNPLYTDAVIPDHQPPGLEVVQYDHVIASTNALECGGTEWGHAKEGGTQGNPEAGAWFCVAWQPQVRELDRELSEEGGSSVAGMDDLFASGPPDLVFAALERFCKAIQEKCLLQLERSKTEVFSWYSSC